MTSLQRGKRESIPRSGRQGCERALSPDVDLVSFTHLKSLVKVLEDHQETGRSAGIVQLLIVVWETARLY